MNFQRASPSSELSRFIECFWMISSNEVTPIRQKIVPDGFPEMIIHFGDPYRINISGTWCHQSRYLLAGQLKKFFFLENTGRSEVFGIKFRPAALTILFGMEMSTLTDDVIDLVDFNANNVNHWRRNLEATTDFQQRIDTTTEFLKAFLPSSNAKLPIEKVVDFILNRYGECSAQELAAVAGVGNRQLELLFQKFIGISPKFYSRVIRFSRIFELVQDENPDWIDIVHLTGYYDQSHFIRNFKAFTGEEPGRYGFDRKDFANFFMNKSLSR